VFAFAAVQAITVTALSVVSRARRLDTSERFVLTQTKLSIHDLPRRRAAENLDSRSALSGASTLAQAAGCWPLLEATPD
jgi:hypothetical protein